MMFLKANRKGVTMVEYGILAALITVLSIAFISSIGKKVQTAFKNVDSNLP